MQIPKKNHPVLHNATYPIRTASAIIATNASGILTITLLTAILIFLNYYFNLEKGLLNLQSWPKKFTGFMVLYFTSYSVSYLLVTKMHKAKPLLLLIIPALFALRISSGNILSFISRLSASPWMNYTAILLNAPMKFCLLLLVIHFIKKSGNYPHSLTGLQRGSTRFGPLIVALICFIPVIMIVAKQPSFLAAYPRYNRIGFIFAHTSQPWITVVGYELSYAFDFLFTEVFFRGLLVFAVTRYIGEAAIFPMAALYCSVHFGKPLAESISSYFGGLVLGYLSLKSDSVVGGLILHLGIGMVMEFAAYTWSH